MRIRKTIGGFFCILLLLAAAVDTVSAGWQTPVPGSAPEQKQLPEQEQLPGQGQLSEQEQLPAYGQALAKMLSELDILSAESFDTLSLYAIAAVLIDADSGRVLYGKEQDTPLAMASTTKIMTCIEVLENADLDDMVAVSSYAASMPKVKLYMNKGEEYQVRELLFSLMLESHNDTAVALAEHVGKQYLPEELKNKDTAEFTVEESRQAVAAFAALMNAKAEALGCTQTHFITPNGLDATETVTLKSGETVTKEHCTTAAELARIMVYCIRESSKRDLFLEITRAENYCFTRNGRSFSCSNHNAFLNMMDGALSGKTGFTNKAGYCYVGALQQDERTFVVALLGCGWPDNKTYKWSDTRELMEYGLEHYEYHDFRPEVTLDKIPIINGASRDGNPYHSVSVPVVRKGETLPIRLLTGEAENVIAKLECRQSLTAPVAEGEEVGKITYYLVDRNGGETCLKEEALYTGAAADAKDFRFMLTYIFRRFIF